LTGHGERIEDAVRAVESPRVVAVGVNCTAPEFVDELLGRIAAVTDLPLVAYPNAGRSYDAFTKTWSGDTSACTFAGARLVGGCCGWGPAAIRALG
jgi:homocysteine S-methyltransferase